ncbi:MAG: hypothetical protein WCH99_16625 [Verrucomicrobiota bacterium]
MPTQTHRLPLGVALAAFLLYAGTMGSELTLNGLPLVSKLAGWDETPMVGHPLLWLLTLPLRLLPAAWAPLLLKLFAAAIAAAILGLLTRTVQMLPWNRPWNATSRLGYALPGLTACAVCGLEFNFWREATATCGDLLDLFLAAAAAWLLLESKARRSVRWLYAATVVWGLGMAENWLMLLAFPLFVTAVVWLKRNRFFDWKFLLRLAGLGLAGFSIYAVLPLANGLLPHSPWTLDQAWIVSLRQTKSLGFLPYQVWRADRFVALAAAICFLLPTLPLLVRMRDEGMRKTFGVDRFQLWLYRSLHLGLLLACFWLAFDPGPGARQMLHRVGYRSPLLVFDYMNAIGAAFLMGNLLLISQLAVRRKRLKNKIPWRRLAVPLATAGFLAVALGLAVRNAPAVWQMNHHPLEKFGELAVKSLPPGGGVVLSDYPEKLLVFQAALARRPDAAKWLAVRTHALPKAEYRALLEQRLPAGWVTDQTRHELTLLETRELLELVARTNRLFYLHPSFGSFMERFYLEPAGLVYEMKRRGNNPLAVPPLSGSALAANEKFWTDLYDQELAPAATARPGSSWWAAKLAKLGLAPAPRDQERLLRDWYSIPLGAWGVALQKQGHLREARVRFEEALQLNGNNLPAWFSLICNTNLQAGNRIGLTDLRKAADQLGKPGQLDAILNSAAPIDEPSVEYLLGSIYYDRGMLIQAAEQMERVRSLIPGAVAPELQLVEIYNRLQMPEHSRPLVDHLRKELRKPPADNLRDMDLTLRDSSAWILQTNPADARDAQHTPDTQQPEDSQIARRVTLAYLALADATNALQLVEEQLAKSPDDIPSLHTKAMILMQSGRIAAALPVLDRVLTLTNLPAARLNRAFARIATEDFARAASDLNQLKDAGPTAGLVDFGLALVAGHKFDTNSARYYLQLCLSNTPPGAPLWEQANAHLRKLQAVK